MLKGIHFSKFKKAKSNFEFVSKKLTHKQIMFCQYYTSGMTGTEAAEKAGYSKDCAHTQSSQNLEKPAVASYIRQLQEDAAKSAKITRERIMNELANIAFGDIRKLYDGNNALKQLKSTPSEVSSAVAAVESDELYDWVDGVKVQIGLIKKVKMHSKIQAIDSLNKMLGYNAPERIENTLIAPNLIITPVSEFKPLSKNETEIDA